MSEIVSNVTAFIAVVFLAFSTVMPPLVQNLPGINQPRQESTLTFSPTSVIPVVAPEAHVQNDVQDISLLAEPEIMVWREHGLTFGEWGNPQAQINILGNVQDADEITYWLNGGSPVTVRVGPDDLRLENQGDFNIALDTSDLDEGTNTVEISATNNSGEISETINFNYEKGNTWPQTYTVNWNSASEINDQAQVVDGRWELVQGGVKTKEVGYDRLIAIGDRNWTHNYEVTVPITVHSFHPDPDNTADSGGVGVIVRWQGHQGPDPLPSDWRKIGAYAYYSNRREALTLRLNGSQIYTEDFSFDLNRTYMFKLRAETVSGSGRYSFKIWAQNELEPAWESSAFSNLVNVIDNADDLLEGSMLLVAHRADATFGDVVIHPILSEPINYDYSTYLPFISR